MPYSHEIDVLGSRRIDGGLVCVGSKVGVRTNHTLEYEW